MSDEFPRITPIIQGCSVLRNRPQINADDADFFLYLRLSCVYLRPKIHCGAELNSPANDFLAITRNKVD
ncbi:MAG: hypothetical protein GWP17_06390 [Aquificales bacterium]|nr:hypothetical protein [Aquificales bacterium]